MSNQVSGMAASIRAAVESETFDLAGHSASNIETTVTSAFSDPFSLTGMIRITFVVGAGKLSRQKYDDKAMQHVTGALKKLGYVEDRGASCVNECGGSFKTQHDTGKNLFTVVVFPKLVDGNGSGDTNNPHDDGVSDEYPILIPLVEDTAEHKVLLASEATFEKMAPSVCPSWTEKKFLSEVLKAALDTVNKMDSKLMTGRPLLDDEQEFYDAVGGSTVISTKMEFLKKIMQQQVESGSMTSSELDKLILQVSERIDTLNDDIQTATQQSKEKKVANLNMQKEKATARKKMLEGQTPETPHPLKHENQIMKLKKQLQPLLKLEQSAKGKLLSMKETRELAAKDEILDEIAELEEASRGWFEDDDTFQVRLDASRSKKVTGSGPSKSSSGAGKKPGTGSRSAGGSTNWVTPGGLAAKQAALGKKTAVKSKPKSGGGVFAAMMMDSDSDSE
ncbi:hypothetical protein ACHAWO_002604 [Cyclotella atomus]|uniref:Uncharacterized protein n=1 Tax=Cyclotella atomus TaxID=382360 RepID=A0ABD3QEB9_9STRA